MYFGNSVMPKIKYAPWLAFLEQNKFENNEEANKQWLEFIPLTLEWLDQTLLKVRYENQLKQQQARALIILGFWTGLRPTEILGLGAANFNKNKNLLEIKVQAAKHGKSGTISIPFNKYLLEVYNFFKSYPNEYGPVLTKFISKKPNKVSWTTRTRVIKVNPDGSKEPIENALVRKSRTYPRNSEKIKYFAQKWLGFPFYYFRHNRLAQMHQLGANLDQITESKLGKSSSSTVRYVRFGSVEAKKRAKYYKVY